MQVWGITVVKRKRNWFLTIFLILLILVILAIAAFFVLLNYTDISISLPGWLVFLEALLTL